MRKTLHFGGSFNPIHIGHLICCRAAAENAGFDRTVLIPAGEPWQKLRDGNLASEVAGASQRLEMCRLAIEENDQFEVDPMEVNRAGPSYAIDTVQALRRAGARQVDWLIGADTMTRLSTWHQSDELFKLVHFRVMHRPGTTLDLSTIPPGCRVTPIAAPLIDISATEIRQRVATGQSIDFLTPPPVVRYIAQHGLYRNAPTAS